MAAEPRGPAVRSSSANTGGRGALIKAPADLQDLRRRLYARAKAVAVGPGGVGGDNNVAAESAAMPLGRITSGVKRAGERCTGNPSAPFDVAGAGDGLTARLVRHSRRKRGAPDRPDLRGTAPALDPTLGEGAAATPLSYPTHLTRLRRVKMGRFISPSLIEPTRNRAS
jgi:hypothetical protein